MTDLDLARQCADAYESLGALYGRDGCDNIRASVVPGGLAFRGSSDPRDWLIDLIALPFIGSALAGLRQATGQNWGKLGVVHEGFMMAAESIYPAVPKKPGLILTGHSLGGALAVVVGALLAVDGYPPSLIVTFGAPRAGYSLRDALKGIPVRQYRAGVDPVPMLPWDPYQHVSHLISLDVETLNPLANHDIECYIGALARALRPALGQVHDHVTQTAF